MFKRMGMTNLEPIRQTWGDDLRAEIVAQELHLMNPEWYFYPTPPFYFTDYHVQRRRANGRENYIGDLEVKWLNATSEVQTKFPFQKLQKILIAPPYNDGIQHKICFRYKDGLLLLPAVELGGIIPEYTTRYDTNERDLNVLFYARDYKQYWIDKIVNQ